MRLKWFSRKEIQCFPFPSYQDSYLEKATKKGFLHRVIYYTRSTPNSYLCNLAHDFCNCLKVELVTFSVQEGVERFSFQLAVRREIGERKVICWIRVRVICPMDVRILFLF